MLPLRWFAVANRLGCDCGCDKGAREKLYPICRIGQMLIFIGVGMAFLSFVFGFWLAFLGAILALIGFLVIMNC